MSYTVIRIEDLYKEYRLGVIGHGTLYRDMQSWWAHVRGKEDPNSRIGHRQNGRTRGDNNRVLALKDINLEIEKGEILGVIGRNGAGKSTLLKIISRITAPTKGCVKIKGRVGSLLEVGTGFHPELTGRENIYLNGAILGMTKSEVHSKIGEIMDFAGVEEYIDTPVKRYSSGMHVRLAFSVAAHLDPEILVVDEVLAVGDYDFQKKCLGKMDDISREGRTVIIVSHNMASIVNLSKRTILLNAGEIDTMGNTQEVVDKYLDGGATYGSEAIWPDPEEAPGDDTLKLHSARILSENNTLSNHINMSDGVKIEIKYWNLKEGNKVWAGIHLFNRGHHIFASTNAPTETVNPDPYWNKPHTVGLYKTLCKIPGRLLNEGAYEVNIALGLDTLRVICHEERLIGFTIIDTVTTTKKGGKPVGGILRPRLDWKTDVVNNSY